MPDCSTPPASKASMRLAFHLEKLWTRSTAISGVMTGEFVIKVGNRSGRRGTRHFANQRSRMRPEAPTRINADASRRLAIFLRDRGVRPSGPPRTWEFSVARRPPGILDQAASSFSSRSSNASIRYSRNAAALSGKYQKPTLRRWALTVSAKRIGSFVS